MRPIVNPRNQAVLQRINVAILDMTGEIGFISDQVFPEPGLPDATLITSRLDAGKLFTFGQRFCKSTFDQPPAHRKIGIAGWQALYGVQMIRQYDEGIYCEGIPHARVGNGFAQEFDMIDE